MTSPTFPIRVWFWLMIATLIAVPALTVVVVAAIRPPTPPEVPIADLAAQVDPALAAAVAADVDRWSDPAWQRDLAARLEAAGLTAELVGPAGEPLFRGADGGAVPDGARAVEVAPSLAASTAPVGPGQTLVVSAGSQTLGTARLNLAPDSGQLRLPVRASPEVLWLLPLSQLVALLLIGLVAALSVDRWLLTPLAALNRATRRVGEGDLDAALPTSRVAEVAALAAAFAAMRDALRASLERQDELEQQRRMMIAAVVHDLRTPLFSLRGYLDGLAAGLADTPAKAHRYLQVCRDKADALDRLVNDLFAYARTEYLDESPRRDRLDLREVVARAVDGLQPQATAKGVRLKLAPGAACAVVGDRDLLTRAVENLLDNAIRHSPVGGEVRLGCTASDRGIALAVADDGPGIAAADLPHLFSPLYRSESSRNRKSGGAGLGLTIARRLVRAHGGEVEAANGPAGGAVFSLLLPNPDEDAGSGASAASVPAAGSTPRPAAGVPRPCQRPGGAPLAAVSERPTRPGAGVGSPGGPAKAGDGPP